MLKLLPSIFNVSKSERQPCVVVAGDDADQFNRALSIQNPRQALHFYHIKHSNQSSSFKILEQNTQYTVLSFNLYDKDAAKKFIRHVVKAGHVIELFILQPAFNRSQIDPLCSVDEIQLQWQNTGLNAVNLSQNIILHMLRQGRGTLIYLGASPLSPSESYSILSLGLFAGIRALAQSLAREFQPKGLHVVYFMLAQWDSQQQDLMQSIATTCWHLHHQPSSTWTHELSL